MLWWFPHTARLNFLHYILGLNPSRQSASKSCLEIPQTQHSARHCSYFCCYLLDFKLRGLKMHLSKIYLSGCQVILAAIAKEIVWMQIAPLSSFPSSSHPFEIWKNVLLGIRACFPLECLIQWSRRIALSLSRLQQQVHVIIIYHPADTCSLHETQQHPVYGVIQFMAVTCSYRLLSGFPWQWSQAMTVAMKESLLLPWIS